MMLQKGLADVVNELRGITPLRSPHGQDMLLEIEHRNGFWRVLTSNPPVGNNEPRLASLTALVTGLNALDCHYDSAGKATHPFFTQKQLLALANDEAILDEGNSNFLEMWPCKLSVLGRLVGSLDLGLKAHPFQLPQHTGPRAAEHLRAVVSRSCSFFGNSSFVIVRYLSVGRGFWEMTSQHSSTVQRRNKQAAAAAAAAKDAEDVAAGAADRRASQVGVLIPNPAPEIESFCPPAEENSPTYSCVAAYSAHHDAALVLEMVAGRYCPCWVPMAQLVDLIRGDPAGGYLLCTREHPTRAESAEYLLQGSTMEQLKQKVADLFRETDEDGSGELDGLEFFGVLEKLELGMGPDEAAAMFAEIDKDGGGSVTLSEFIPVAFDLLQIAMQKGCWWNDL